MFNGFSGNSAPLIILLGNHIIGLLTKVHRYHIGNFLQTLYKCNFSSCLYRVFLLRLSDFLHIVVILASLDGFAENISKQIQ